MRLEEERCWLEIDLEKLRRNAAIVEGLAGPGCTPIGVVKTNCYGLGAVEIARELLACGCRILSTADMAEALALRRAGIREPILLLGPAAPESVEAAIRENIILPVVDLENALLLERAAAPCGRLRTHIKVDVGMNRLGIPVNGREEEAREDIRRVTALPHLTNEGLMTHISGMQDPALDHLNVEQLERFSAFGDFLAEIGICLPMHCESSMLFLSHPEYHQQFARLTSAYLGIEKGYEPLGARCVARLCTRVLQIKQVKKGDCIGYWMTYAAPRDMTVAVLGVGYGDGLVRGQTRGAHMLIRGRRVEVVGKLSMSFSVADITDVPDVRLGDEVTVFGETDGGGVSIREYAELYGGHPCEVIAMLKEHIPRVYLHPRPGAASELPAGLG